MITPYFPPVTSDTVIDLYHGNNVASFTAAAESGIKAVILKADQGTTFDDPLFVKRTMQVIAAGMLLGAYHFFDSSDPEKQVKHFANAVAATQIPGIIRVVDFEPSTTTTAIENALAAYITATGPTTLIYTGRWAIPSAVPIFYECPLWLPEYGSNPVCPPGWSKWKMWQHTDGTVGSAVVPVPGIGPCDRSYFAGTPSELSAWWLNPTP